MTARTVVAASFGLSVLVLAGGISIMPRPAHAAPAGAEVVTFYVLPDEQGIPGPDGKHHDTFLPSSVIVMQGVPITLRFVNYDDMSHTMTVPGLGLNIVIAAATPRKSGVGTMRETGSEESGSAIVPGITTYRLTPTKIGQFRWHCNVMCDPWAMRASTDGPSRDGFMAGYIVVRK